jgi:hypothetical protein
MREGVISVVFGDYVIITGAWVTLKKKIMQRSAFLNNLFRFEVLQTLTLAL